MGRWRPPREKGSPYITKAGADKLEAEMQYLWKTERPIITEAVYQAALNGDRSENGDYIYNKKRLREIDSRVRFISKRLDELNVVDRVPNDTSKVFFGAWVTIEDDEGESKCYQIVGPDEFDLKQNKISMDSPIAQRLLKKTIGDEVSIPTPNGELGFYIDKIEYKQ